MFFLFFLAACDIPNVIIKPYSEIYHKHRREEIWFALLFSLQGVRTGRCTLLR